MPYRLRGSHLYTHENFGVSSYATQEGRLIVRHGMTFGVRFTDEVKSEREISRSRR